MLKTRAVLAACILLALSVPVIAMDADKLFDKLDSDKNGVISREEFTSCPLLRVKDQKGKSKIQHGDLCVSPGVSLSIEEKNRLFEKLDKDKSGSISRKELYKYATPDGIAPIRF